MEKNLRAIRLYDYLLVLLLIYYTHIYYMFQFKAVNIYIIYTKHIKREKYRFKIK